MNRDPAEVEAKLEKLSFSGVPQELIEAIGHFSDSSISISQLMAETFEDVTKLSALISQYRFGEAAELAVTTYAKLPQISQDLTQIEGVIKIIGEVANIGAVPEESSLRNAYDELFGKMGEIQELLDSYKDIPIESLLGAVSVEELVKILREKGITVEDLMEMLEKEGTTRTLIEILAGDFFDLTNITLILEPEVAFTGSTVSFEGVLMSGEKALAGREIDILINGTKYLTTKTRVNGRYKGTLEVPYWYVPGIDLQALYYPRDEDIGHYISSLSPVMKLDMLYYETGLQVTAEDKAYPGMETTITGRFHYGQSPPAEQRRVEIYLDDVLMAELMTGEEFSQKIKLDAELDTGTHMIYVSAVADGRYSPATASAVVNVIKPTPILDINKPMVAMIPGSIVLEGKLYSEIGPLRGALIKIGLGKSQVELVSSEDGTFNTEIKKGTEFNLIGLQDLEIMVIPQEPWHATLLTTRNIITVNMVSCSGILVLLVLVGIFLPGRLRARYSWRRAGAAAAIAHPEPAPIFSESMLPSVMPERLDGTDVEPRIRIFYWYRLIVGLVQRITRALLKPQQTLREFTNEVSPVLGPPTKYLIELTRMVERLLYSQYRATEEDAEKSKQLSNQIEKEFEPEATTEPLYPSHLQGEEMVAQLHPARVSFVHRVGNFILGGRASMTDPWRQHSTWLWILLITTVIYFACMLLFLIPLLVASLAY